MGTSPTKRAIPPAGEPEGSAAAEAVSRFDVSHAVLSGEDIAALQAFFLLLDRWDRELADNETA